MRKYKLFIFLVLFMFPALVKAESVEYTLFDSYIKVNQDRTLDITEEYKPYFIENTTSTTRIIGLNPSIIRPNKSRVYSSTLISDISSSIKNKQTKKNSSQIINFKVNGLQDSVKDYTLNYKYNLGKDELRGKDELYYSIVKNLDAPISNLTFTLEFPTNIENAKIYFAIDNKYNLNRDDISYEVKDNKITGALNILLSNNQSFSIYVELPDNYFKGATDNFNYSNYLYIIIPFICFLLVYLFYRKYGRGISLNIKRKDTIYNNFDSAEIGYLYKGKLEEMSLTSLVIYLATKGYLKIVEHDDGYKLGKDNTFHFIKLKDYDKNNAAQELLFNELFRDRDKTELKDIEYHFADTFKEARNMLDNEDNYKKMFFVGLKQIKIISAFLIVLSLIVNNVRSIYLVTNSYLLIAPIVLAMIFGLYVVLVSNMTGLIKAIVGTIILTLSLYIGISPIIVQKHFLIIYIIESILIALMCLLFKKLSERTKFGTEVLGETYGLKYYLETITKEELKNKIEENPNYFYDMIPYACTLDSLESWMRSGKDIVTEAPSWYIPSSEFSLKNFEKFINNVLYTTSLVMMKQVYSESELVTYENRDIKTKLND